MKQLCQEGPAVGALIDPPRLPWLVYAYGPDGFAQEHPVGRNTMSQATLSLKAPRR